MANASGVRASGHAPRRRTRRIDVPRKEEWEERIRSVARFIEGANVDVECHRGSRGGHDTWRHGSALVAVSEQVSWRNRSMVQTVGIRDSEDRGHDASVARLGNDP